MRLSFLCSLRRHEDEGEYAMGRDANVHDYEETVIINLPLTDAGMLRLLCPDETCTPRDFLVKPGQPEGQAEISNNGSRSGEDIRCPYCGEIGDQDAFTHPEDRQYVERMNEVHLQRIQQELVERTLQPLFKTIDSFDSIKSDFLSATVEREPVRWPRPPVPIAPEKVDLLRNLMCGRCGGRHGVYAFAHYCPDCGRETLVQHLEKDLRFCQTDVDSAADLEAQGEIEHARLRLTSTHSRAVTLLEAYLKRVYRLVVRSRKPNEADALLAKVRTSFQRVDSGRRLFNPFGLEPSAALSDAELRELDVALSKRHVIAHSHGEVDVDYVKKSNVGKLGTALPLDRHEVERALDLVRKVISHCATVLPEYADPNEGVKEMVDCRRQ